ncbi:MAG: hypothetical protein DRP54_01600 [Spirochaetes bacterium]|nr:MAG: hypothetical protein DRP54_01600 [Spirochaetota bacterium]
MRTLGIGVVGAGFMGKTHTYNYVNMPLFYDNLPVRIKLIGICSRTLSKAEKLRDDYGYEFATTNYEDLLDRKDIDIIDICTPNCAHHNQIMKALDAGKHLYVDKPLCITDEEADEIVSKSQGLDLINMVAYHNRFYPAMKKMKQLVEEGFLGRPLFFRLCYYHASNLNPDTYRGWRQELDSAGGGVLYDMGSHILDLLYYIFGNYEKGHMQSMILYPQRPGKGGKPQRVLAEDHVLINAVMKNGSFGTLEASKVIAGSNDDLIVELYGEKGSIKFNLMDPNFLYIYDTRDTSEPIGGMRGFRALETVNKDPDSKGHFPGQRFGIGWLRGHIASQYSFVVSVVEGKRASPDFKDGAYIQKVMNRLYQSSKTDEWVSF